MTKQSLFIGSSVGRLPVAGKAYHIARIMRRCVWRLVCTFLSFVAAAPVSAAGDGYLTISPNGAVLGNSQLELAFSAQGNLIRFLDKATQRNLLSGDLQDFSGTFFTYTRGNSNEVRNSGGYQARQVHFSPLQFTGGVALTIDFSDLAEADGLIASSLSVQVRLADADTASRWMVRVTPAASVTVENVSIISLGAARTLSDQPSDDAFIHPNLSGVLIRDPLHTFKIGRGFGWQMYYPSGQATMQFAAYYSEQPGMPGIYVAADDPDGYLKYFSLSRPSATQLRLAVDYTPPLDRGSTIAPPFPIVLSIHKGSWMDAATTYRTWALRQPWARRGSLNATTEVPRWLLSASYSNFTLTRPWTQPYFGFDAIEQLARSWQGTLGRPALVNWEGWERDGSFVNPPDSLPPVEGWARFDEAVAAAHAIGGRLMFLPTTGQAATSSANWGQLSTYATRQHDGGLVQHSFSALDKRGQPVQQTFVQMDPVPSWSGVVQSIVNPLVDHGADLVQFDGNMSAAACFAADHGHPKGGGNWWAQGYRSMLAAIRERGRARRSDFAMSVEWPADFYLDLLDAASDPTSSGMDWGNIGAGSLEAPDRAAYIPLWQAVYHDRLVSHAMITFIDGRDKDYYRRSLGLSLSWGAIPMLLGEADFGRPDFASLYPAHPAAFDPDLLALARRIVDLRSGFGRDFVSLGRMLAPPQVQTTTFTIPSASSIPYSGGNTTPIVSQSILSSSWLSPSGDVAYIFVNISGGNANLQTTLRLPADPSLPTLPYQLSLIRNGDAQQASESVSMPRQLNLTLASGEVVLAIARPRARNAFSCLMIWAEPRYAEVLGVKQGQSGFLAPFEFRYYPATGSYVGWSQLDDRFYYLGPASGNAITDLGPIRDWLQSAKCQ